jgi:hypothetical protein
MFHVPERIHKRPFIVGFIVLAAVLLVSAGLIAVLDIFGATSDLPVVSLKASPDGNAVSGIGINIPYIPTSNLVVNPSFEDVTYDQIYTVSGATTNSVFVLPDKAIDTYYTDNFFAGGKIRIMSLDENGEMITKLVSEVTGFEMNQLGLWNTLAVPENTSEGQSILALSSSPSISVAAGSDRYGRRGRKRQNRLSLRCVLRHGKRIPEPQLVHFESGYFRNQFCDHFTVLIQ